MGVEIYIGADAGTIQGRRYNLLRAREFSAAYGPNSKFTPDEVPHVRGLLDSGAFSDVRSGKRMEVDAALARQLRWEEKASTKWGASWQAEAIVSYDLLIDEKLVGGIRKKERWGIVEAEAAVRATIDAAAYLASQRERLAPRRLVLSIQGVDHVQQSECAAGVLEHALPCDWLGLGGWCILGMQRSWLPQFWATINRVLPMAAAKGIRHAHIFGVMWPPALGPLLWRADALGMTVSTDSSGPAMALTWKDRKKCGLVRCDTWEENCSWWRDHLAGLREGEHYRAPPANDLRRQLTIW